MPDALVPQAAILVGGKGTRLGALTAATPKPLLEVGGRPFLDWLLDEVARHGIPRITLLAGFEAEQRGSVLEHRARRADAGEGALPVAQVGQEVLPLAGHQLA